MQEVNHDQNSLIDIAELSGRLDISVNTIYSWVNQRKIPYIKIGRLLKFDQQDINSWIAQRKVDVWDKV